MRMRITTSAVAGIPIKARYNIIAAEHTKTVMQQLELSKYKASFLLSSQYISELDLAVSDNLLSNSSEKSQSRYRLHKTSSQNEGTHLAVFTSQEAKKPESWRRPIKPWRFSSPLRTRVSTCTSTGPP